MSLTSPAETRLEQELERASLALQALLSPDSQDGFSGWCLGFCPTSSAKAVQAGTFFEAHFSNHSSDKLSFVQGDLAVRALEPRAFRTELETAIEILESGRALGPAGSVLHFVVAQRVEQTSVDHCLHQLVGAAEAKSDETLLRLSAMGSDWLGLSGASNEQQEPLEAFLENDRLRSVDQGIYQNGDSEPEVFETLARFAGLKGEILTATAVLNGQEPDETLTKLDQAMLEQSIARLVAHPDLRLSINVCRTTLLDDKWHRRFASLQEQEPEAFQRAVFEVTEWPARAAHTPISLSTQPIVDLGSHVWLDDFGAGLTSFNEIFVRGITGLKVDRSLLRRSIETDDSFGLLDIVSSFAARRGIACVIEGAEDDEERLFAERHGATHVQGFFSGKI